MAELSFNSTAWKELLQKLNRSAKGAHALIKSAFSIYGFKDIDDHFRNEEGENGKWKKRTKTTQMLYALINKGKLDPKRVYPGSTAGRGSYNPSNKLLQLQGFLRQSFLPSGIKTVSKNSIMIVSNSPYSGKHDRGEDGMVQRKFMWVSQRTMERMGETILSLWMQGK